MKSKIIQSIIVVLVMIGVVIIMNLVNKEEITVNHISMDDVVEVMEREENYIILDVRTLAEYNEGHIPNAINLANESITEDSASKVLKNKDQLILVYCRSGNRSKQAAEKLKDLGYTNITEFGGIIDWKGEIEK